MALLVVIVTVFALYAPLTLKWAASEITVLLGLAMFGMGMTLRIEDFELVLERPRDVCVGVAAQFTIMPFLAWGGHYFCFAIGDGTRDDSGRDMSGGTASNIMTYLAKGDVALSVAMTMTTTLLAPVVTPLLTLWLAGAWIEVSFFAMMYSILQVVIAPIVLGVFINKYFGKNVQKIVKLLPTVSIIAILLIVGGVVAVSAERMWEAGLAVMAATLCHNLLGYVLGFSIAKAFRMDTARTKAI